MAYSIIKKVVVSSTELDQKLKELETEFDGYSFHVFDSDPMTYRNSDGTSYSMKEIVISRYVDENRKSPSQFWDEWVGSQTPQEFMATDNVLTIEEAVDDYMDEMIANFDGNFNEDIEKIKKGLITYIEEQTG